MPYWLTVVCIVFAGLHVLSSAVNMWRDRYDRAAYNVASATLLYLVSGAAL
jgi:hypothetical protein